MLSHVIKELAASGYSEFTVGAEADNAAAKYIYNEFGFTKTIANKREAYQGTNTNTIYY